MPVVEYPRRDGKCAIIGGAVYRGPTYYRMQGIYFYADFCQGYIWGLRREGDTWRNALLYDAPFMITSFGEDEAGELYVTDADHGVIYQIADVVTSTPTSTPTATATASPTPTMTPSPTPSPTPARWYLPLLLSTLAS